MPRAILLPHRSLLTKGENRGPSSYTNLCRFQRGPARRHLGLWTKAQSPDPLPGALRQVFVDKSEALGKALRMVPVVDVPVRAPEVSGGGDRAKTCVGGPVVPSRGVGLDATIGPDTSPFFRNDTSIRARMREQARMSKCGGAPPLPAYVQKRDVPQNVLGELVHGWLEHWAFTGEPTGDKAKATFASAGRANRRRAGSPRRRVLRGWRGLRPCPSRLGFFPSPPYMRCSDRALRPARMASSAPT